MLHRTERTLENIPVGALGLIPVVGSEGTPEKRSMITLSNGGGKVPLSTRMMWHSPDTKRTLTL